MRKGKIAKGGFQLPQKKRQETMKGLERIKAGNPGFHCKECGKWFQPQPTQWIFYLLCDSCFATFDKQRGQKWLDALHALTNKEKPGKKENYKDVLTSW